MIKFHDNFTTQEQSAMLLKLGVPEDSADLYYIYEDEAMPSVLPYKKLFSEWQRESQGLTKGNYFTNPMYGIIPCWSVGRLIEIIRHCTDGVDIYLYDAEQDDMIQNLVGCIACNTEKFDFSKLECNE